MTHGRRPYNDDLAPNLAAESKECLRAERGTRRRGPKAPSHDDCHPLTPVRVPADPTDQRFCHTGGRFSANAFGPSFASSLENTSLEISDSIL